MTTTHAAAAQPAPARSFAALRHAGFRPYFLGTMLVMMADSIEHVISYWIIFEKFHSPALGGFAVISHWVPFLLFSVWAGGLADRFDARRIIQIGMVLFMIASLGWGTLFLTGELEQWHAVVLLVIHGMAGVFWSPAAQLILHDIVGPAQLQSAVRLLSTARNLGLLLGPAVGGALLLALGPSTGLFLNALIYLPLTLWLWKAPYGPRFRTEKQPPARRLGDLADVTATLRQIAAEPVIAPMILLAGAASFFVGSAFQAQMPAFAVALNQEESGLGYSILLSGYAAGALAAGIALETGNLLRARAETAFVLVALWCASLVLFATATSFALAVALLFAAGFLNLAYGAMCQTLVQLHAPVEIRGRVIGLYQMSALGLMSFSGVTVGIGGSFVGVHWSLGLSAACLLAVTLAMMRRRLRAR